MYRQKGFGVVQILLIVVVIGIVGFTGWFVWQSRKNIDSVSSSNITNVVSQIGTRGGSCSLGVDYSGTKYTTFGGAYTLCLPNGWDFGVVEGGKRYSGVLIASGTYQQNKPITLSATQGGDGPVEFAIYMNSPVAGVGTEYTKTGTIQSQNTTGHEYTYSQKTDPNEGLGGLPKGTESTVFYFVKDNHDISIVYNQFSGETDKSALVKEIARSLTIN